MAHLQRAGHLADAVNSAVTLAAIRVAQGRLREARRTYAQGLRLATKQGEPVVRGAADMHIGLREIARERDDLPAARQHLLRSKELGEHSGFAQNRYRWSVAMARIQEAEGDRDGALALLDEAQRRYMSDFSPNLRPVAAMKARVWHPQSNPHIWGRRLPTFFCIVQLRETHTCNDAVAYGGGKSTRRRMNTTHTSTGDAYEPGRYEIRLKGHLDTRWADWFEGLTITLEDNGETHLTGPMVDQAALHGLLRKVRDLGLPLVSVMRVDPTQANGMDGDADHHCSNKEPGS